MTYKEEMQWLDDRINEPEEIGIKNLNENLRILKEISLKQYNRIKEKEKNNVI